ncbi:MAG TPA: tryptophan--tRNA ligase [Candidatus Paceibacterota bacterium]
MAKGQKILLSGVKPTGRPHIGNYFGAMRQFVDLQDKFDSYVFIADYHALTTLQNAKELSENIVDVALDYLAIGLDPKKVTLFKQSDVSQVMELGWIFNCITTMPYLERAHAYKDAVAKGKREDINVGTFDYPMLMAADILIQDADAVPVGADQKQHVEFARDTAEKFNRIFAESGNDVSRTVFKMPEPFILEHVKVVPGIDGEKMSKSYGNIIPLFASDEEIKKLVMSIVTDSSSDVPKNVYAIHELFRDKKSLDALYEEKKGKYKDLKEALIADITAFIAPLRARREALAKDRAAVLKILKEGGEKARARAEAKMKIVREKVGVEIN